jgi:hypothetical protein
MDVIWTLLTCIVIVYLTVSCLIGVLSLMMLAAYPEEFDEYRSNDPFDRVCTVASVMLLGPITISLAIKDLNR